jgi:hypothetical protein
MSKKQEIKSTEYRLGVELERYFTISETDVPSEYRDLFKHMLDDRYSDERKEDDDTTNYFETREEFVHWDRLRMIVEEVIHDELENYLDEKYNNDLSSVPPHSVRYYSKEEMIQKLKQWKKFEGSK